MLVALECDQVDDVLDVESHWNPIIIEVFTPGCGACHQVGSVLALAQQQHLHKLSIYRLLIHGRTEDRTPARLRISVIPSVLWFRHGVERGRLENVVDAGALWDLVAATLQEEGHPLR